MIIVNNNELLGSKLRKLNQARSTMNIDKFLLKLPTTLVDYYQP